MRNNEASLERGVDKNEAAGDVIFLLPRWGGDGKKLKQNV